MPSNEITVAELLAELERLAEAHEWNAATAKRVNVIRSGDREGDAYWSHWSSEGWESAPEKLRVAILTCAKTGRRVVLPNRQAIVDSCDESEPTLPDSASDHIPDAGKMVTVGSQWRRNSDGKQCVVKSAKESVLGYYDPAVVIEGSSNAVHMDIVRLAEDFTHLFTPKPDLSNLEDGARIVGFDGTVVTVKIAADGGRRLRDADGRFHSVNDLPSVAWRDGSMFWDYHAAGSCLTGPAGRYADGGEWFYIDGCRLSPTEWADKRVEMGATPADVEEPWRHLIVDAIKRAKPKGRRYYSVELREGKKFDAWLVETIPFGCSNYVAKFRAAFQAEKIAKLLNEALEAREAGDGE